MALIVFNYPHLSIIIVKLTWDNPVESLKVLNEQVGWHFNY